jgi:hypothetical protein
LKFFIEGDRLDPDHLPEWMQTKEIRQAMNTLRPFTEKERAYHQHQARQNYLRQQRSIEEHLNALRAEIEQARAAEEQARAAEERERTEKEQERAAKEAALAEIERLKVLLGK